MNKNQTKNWLINQLNLCYILKNLKNIDILFLIYDDKFIRNLKKYDSSDCIYKFDEYISFFNSTVYLKNPIY